MLRKRGSRISLINISSPIHLEKGVISINNILMIYNRNLGLKMEPFSTPKKRALVKKKEPYSLE